jgi:hypothetical protein
MSKRTRNALLSLAALFAFLAPLAVTFAGPAADAGAQPLEAAKLAGHWTGAGRFYNIEFQKQHGPIGFDLTISPDLVLSGTVGGAAVQPAKGERNGKQVDFKVLLVGAVKPGLDPGKDHLVLIFTEASDVAASGDFHLKSNFTLDLTMRPGAIELKRAP